VDREVVRLTRERKPYMNTLAAMAERGKAPAVAFLPFSTGATFCRGWLS